MQAIAVMDPILIEEQVGETMPLLDETQGEAIGGAGRLGAIGGPGDQQGKIQTHVRTPAQMCIHSTSKTKKPLLGGALPMTQTQT